MSEDQKEFPKNYGERITARALEGAIADHLRREGHTVTQEQGSLWVSIYKDEDDGDIIGPLNPSIEFSITRLAEHLAIELEPSR